MKNCIFLTGGGTAGHTMLNINLENELKKYFNKIVYIGSHNGIEKELVTQKTNYEYKSVTTVKLDRKNISKDLAIPILLLKGIKESKRLIQEYNPSIIFSKGGYVGLPITIAGKKLKVPVICHESDLSMGLANKIAKKYAKVICTNFEKTAKVHGKKCKYVGMPLKISNLSQKEAQNKLNIKTNKPVLLVTGGSMGAKTINEFVYQNLTELTKNYFVYHIIGKNNTKEIFAENYMQIPFSNDMQTVFRASDYAISRAGANSCFELLANNILTIFVPLPKGISRGDQIENADYFEKKQLCKVVSQDKLNIENILNSLNYLQKNAIYIKNSIKNAKITDGTEKIIKLILENSK